MPATEGKVAAVNARGRESYPGPLRQNAFKIR
jgi:hypothetical protein